MASTTQPREPFVLVDSDPLPIAVASEESHAKELSYLENCSSGFGSEAQLYAYFRKAYPSHILTMIPTYNSDIIAFAKDGQASVTLDDKTAPYLYKQGVANNGTGDKPPWIVKNILFAKYRLEWQSHEFTVFLVAGDGKKPNPDDCRQFILREANGASEVQDGESIVTNALLLAVGQWQIPKEKAIYVYDRSWTRSSHLYEEVRRASWDDVVLSAAMKHDLTQVVTRFFDSKSVYEELGVPWKRGIIFHGVAGNGKTISIKAIMNALTMRARPIPTLYVKHAADVNAIRLVFLLARRMTPCCLVLEDIETIVNESTRSYFFNEVDGLERNDGILIIGSTNHLEDLDPGLSKRPNRFDRKYHFPLPSADDRALYVDYWRSKMAKNSSVYFPKSLSTRIAGLTQGFTFAYMQEAFVTALLVLAGNRSDATMTIARDGTPASSKADAENDEGDCELYTVLQREILALRAEMKISDDALNGGGGDNKDATSGMAPGTATVPARSGLRQYRVPAPLGFNNFPGEDKNERWNPFQRRAGSGTNEQIPRNVL